MIPFLCWCSLSLTTGCVASCVTSRRSSRCSVLWRVAQLCYICKCFRCLLISPTSLLTFSLTPRGFIAFILISSLCVAAAFVFVTVVFFATITGLCIYSSIPLILIPLRLQGPPSSSLCSSPFLYRFSYPSHSLGCFCSFVLYCISVRNQPSVTEFNAGHKKPREGFFLRFK